MQSMLLLSLSAGGNKIATNKLVSAALMLLTEGVVTRTQPAPGGLL